MTVVLVDIQRRLKWAFGMSHEYMCVTDPSSFSSYNHKFDIIESVKLYFKYFHYILDDIVFNKAKIAKFLSALDGASSPKWRSK